MDQMDSKKKLKDFSDFKLIVSKFDNYWKTLLFITFGYVFFYSLWSLIRSLVKEFGKLSKSVNIVFKYSLIFSIVFLRGGLFSLDGLVTSWLKTPFNQICYIINKTEEMEIEKKDRIILKITESNEHCKETFKKFGVLTMSSELVDLLFWLIDIELKKQEKDRERRIIEWILLISYFVPLSFATVNILQIKKMINEIVKSALFHRKKEILVVEGK